MDWLRSPLWIIGILLVNIAISELLVRKTRLKPLGTALLVILVTAVVANLGIIPTNANEAPVYESIFNYVAPISIFLLLLEVNLKNLKKAGGPMILLFVLGSMGTVLGVFVADNLVNAKETIGPLHFAISGMFTGTYTGGSINFNAVALHYEVNKEGNLFAGAVAIDNILTTIWMVLTLGLPKFFQQFFPRGKQKTLNEGNNLKEMEMNDDEKFGPLEIGILLGMGVFTLFISNLVADWLSTQGFQVPSILILTTVALIFAQFDFVQKIKGSRLMGLVGMYLFLAVIGAFCDLSALGTIGSLALVLLIYVLIMILVHGLVIFGIGGLTKMDWDMISIASQANVGGSTSALALSRSLGRPDLMLPAVLVGVLGNGLGTYLGFLVAGYLN